MSHYSQQQPMNRQAPGGEVDAEATRAVALMSCEIMRGTPQWAWLCPGIFMLSIGVSVMWLWASDDLVPERRGYVFMGLLCVCWAAVVLSKRVRDEQYADVLGRFGKSTRLYHSSTIVQLRGTDSFRNSTRVAMVVSIVALFGGLWLMPFHSSSKWLIATMCVQTLGCTFMYAQHRRNIDTAESFLRILNNLPEEIPIQYFTALQVFNLSFNQFSFIAPVTNILCPSNFPKDPPTQPPTATHFDTPEMSDISSNAPTNGTSSESTSTAATTTTSAATTGSDANVATAIAPSSSDSKDAKSDAKLNQMALDVALHDAAVQTANRLVDELTAQADRLEQSVQRLSAMSTQPAPSATSPTAPAPAPSAAPPQTVVASTPAQSDPLPTTTQPQIQVPLAPAPAPTVDVQPVSTAVASTATATTEQAAQMPSSTTAATSTPSTETTSTPAPAPSSTSQPTSQATTPLMSGAPTEPQTFVSGAPTEPQTSVPVPVPPPVESATPVEAPVSVSAVISMLHNKPNTPNNPDGTNVAVVVPDVISDRKSDGAVCIPARETKADTKSDATFGSVSVSGGGAAPLAPFGTLKFIPDRVHYGGRLEIVWESQNATSRVMTLWGNSDIVIEPKNVPLCHHQVVEHFTDLPPGTYARQDSLHGPNLTFFNTPPAMLLVLPPMAQCVAGADLPKGHSSLSAVFDGKSAIGGCGTSMVAGVTFGAAGECRKMKEALDASVLARDQCAKELDACRQQLVEAKVAAKSEALLQSRLSILEAQLQQAKGDAEDAKRQLAQAKTSDEWIFHLDKTMLRRDQNFVPASVRLLDTHTEMATAAWRSSQDIRRSELAWSNKRDSSTADSPLDPLELVPSLQTAAPSYFGPQATFLRPARTRNGRNGQPDAADAKDIEAPENQTKYVRDRAMKGCPLPPMVSASMVGQQMPLNALDDVREKWMVTEEVLGYCNRDRSSVAMGRLLSHIRVFAENPKNPFQKTAQDVQPMAEQSVQLLNGAALPEKDEEWAALIGQSVLEPANQLLESPLRSLFLQGRSKLEALMTRVKQVEQDLEVAKASRDIKTMLQCENEYIARLKAAAQANSDLRRLLQQPSHAEQFLHPTRGKLACARERVADFMRAERASQSVNEHALQEDLVSLDRLTSAITRHLCAELSDRVDEEKRETSLSEALGLEMQDIVKRDVWHFKEDKALYTRYLDARKRAALAKIQQERIKHARENVAAELAQKREQLERHGAWLTANGKLVELIDQIIGRGIAGVEEELRERLDLVQRDMASLEQGYAELFSKLYRMLGARAQELKTRQKTNEDSLAKLEKNMAQAWEERDVPAFEEIKATADKARDGLLRLQSELADIGAEICRQDDDSDATEILHKLRRDHPRLAVAVAAEEAKRKAEVAKLEATITHLAALGINIAPLLPQLQQLPHHLQQITGASGCTGGCTSGPTGLPQLLPGSESASGDVSSDTTECGRNARSGPTGLARLQVQVQSSATLVSGLCSDICRSVPLTVPKNVFDAAIKRSSSGDSDDDKHLAIYTGPASSPSHPVSLLPSPTTPVLRAMTPGTEEAATFVHIQHPGTCATPDFS